MGKNLRAHTIVGHQDYVLVGDLPDIMEVWYNLDSMLNILAWLDVRKKFCITADTSIRNAITVHLPNEQKMVLKEVVSGLYIFNDSNHYKKSVSSYSFLILVEGNKKDFTKREITAAKKAQILYRDAGMPGYKRFMGLLDRNYFRNFKINSNDVKGGYKYTKWT